MLRLKKHKESDSPKNHSIGYLNWMIYKCNTGLPAMVGIKL